MSRMIRPSSKSFGVGVGAMFLGGAVGGHGLGSLSKRQVTALESGDEETARTLSRRSTTLAYVVTLLPIIAILAMVAKWRASYESAIDHGENRRARQA